LAVEYNGKVYGNGGTISVSNKEELFNLTLKNTVEGEAISWNTLTGETSVTNPFSVSFPSGKNEITIEGIQGNRKVTVVLKKLSDFELNTLIVYDAKKGHEGRFASVGETLYMIGEGELKAVAKGKSNEYQKSFTHPDLSWAVIYEGQSNPKTSFDGKSSFVYNLPNPNTEKRISVEARDANGLNKEVFIESIKENRIAADWMPPATSMLITSKYDELKSKIDQFNSKFTKFGVNFKFEVKPLKMKGEKYNEEKNKSPQYNNVLKGNINGGLSLKPENDFIFYPPFLEPLNLRNPFDPSKRLTECGFYITPKLELNVIGGVEIRTNAITKVKSKNNFYVEINPKGCIEGGVKFKTLVAQDYFEVEVKGFGEVCLSGKYRVYDTSDDVGGSIQLDPLVIGVKAKVKSKSPVEFTLVDISTNYAISNAYKF
jgi:hypothetical protein